MKLADYLSKNDERAGAFGRRINVGASTVSGWLNDPKRGPSRANLVAIERATGGQVTARDFALGEESGIVAETIANNAATAEMAA